MYLRFSIVLAVFLLLVGCSSTQETQTPGAPLVGPNMSTAQFAMRSVLSEKGLTCQAMQDQTGVSFRFAENIGSASISLADGQTFTDLPIRLIDRHWKRSTNDKGNRGGLCLGAQIPGSATGSWGGKRSLLCVKWSGGDGSQPTDWRFWTWWTETPTGVKEGRSC